MEAHDQHGSSRSDRTKPATGGQIKLVWYLIRKAGLDAEWLRGFLEDNYQIRSLHQFDFGKMGLFIDQLKQMIGEARDTWRITSRQKYEIQQRQEALGISDEGMRALVRRQTGHGTNAEEVRWMSWREARGLIACMERMRAVNEKKKAVPV